VDGPLKQSNWLEERGGEGNLLVTFNGLILEVCCLERAMEAMPVLIEVVVVLGALGRVPTMSEDL
jgi:hypothetical protein